MMLKLIRNMSLVLIGIIAVFIFWLALKQLDYREIFEVSKVTTVKRDLNAPVIGELGGVEVSIPRAFARFVEYEGDSHFMEKREGAVPERTFDSKIRSFGFEIRFPDGASRDQETSADRVSRNIYNTNWLMVGVRAAKDPVIAYGGLKRMIDAYKDPKLNLIVYEKMSSDVFGLEGYKVLREKIEKKPSSSQEQRKGKNFYYAVDELGHPLTFIRCSNSQFESAQCEQFFYLGPDMSVHLNVAYRRDLLREWKNIQAQVKEKILGFKR